MWKQADAAEVTRTFREAVNMTPSELGRWLETAESLSVGARKAPGDESVGHASGRRIVELLRKRGGYTDDEIRHMRKVIGYVRRHSAQRPNRDITSTRWRYSLMNWGHDPLRP